jgi:fructooligosaccharide transport system substrate-binding protein
MKKLLIVVLGILMCSQLAFAEVNLVMWQHQSGEAETNYYLSRIEAFNKAYDGQIKVEVNVIPRGGGNAYEEKVNMGAAAGDLPDIVDMDGPYTTNYAYSKILRPLDDMIDKESDWFKNYVPAMIQQGTYNGKLYSLGAMESSVGVYFNKGMLAEYGIAEPAISVEDGWTFDEFVAVLDELRQKVPEDVYPIIGLGGDVNEWLTYMGAPFIWSNGGRLISEDGKVVDGVLNSAENIEAMTKIQELFTKGYTVNDPGERAFERQKAVMMMSGPWGVPGLADYPEIEWGIAPYPVLKTNSSPTGSWCWGVSTASEHPKEALEVLKWLTSTESTVGLSEITGMLPTTVDAYDELAAFNEPPQRVFMEQQLKGAQARPSTPAYPVLTQEFAQAWYDIIFGKDVEKALNEATDKTARYIKRRMK